MNIVKEILKLRRAIRALRPSAGTGMAVEVTPSGTRYSLLEEAKGGSGGMGWHGMFELVDASETIEGELVMQVAIINGADRDSGLCGVAHVNRQPFEVPKSTFAVGAQRLYVYLVFVAPVEGDNPLPASVLARAETGLQESTDTVVWHLVGQAWIEDKELRIQQDHLPGNAYIEWYGPCLGLLEEK